MAEEGIGEVLQNLADAIGNLNVNKVPPPLPYKNVGSIEDFFTKFERYAQSQYQQDHDSYLSILPSFLEGEAKNIVFAFGNGAGITYANVKERLIAELTTRRTIGSNQYTDFFGAKRRPGESLVCYSIRLQSMADKLPNASQQTKAVMTSSKFLGGLPPAVSRQVNIHMANNANATLEQIVKLATILDSSEGTVANVMTGQQDQISVDVTPDPYLGWGECSQTNAIPPLMNIAAQAAPSGGLPQCYVCKSPAHYASDCPVVKTTRCYNCQDLGHIAKNCTKTRKPRGNNGVGNQWQGNNRNNNGRNSNNSNSNAHSSDNNNSRNCCAFCNKRGHIMAQCHMFKAQMQACVWCGESHASHTCEHKPSSGNGRASGQ